MIATLPSRQEQIDALRREFYGDQPMLNDPAVQYSVVTRNGVVTAMYGLKIEGKRALVVDFYGKNARDLVALKDVLLAWADGEGYELSAWVFNTNKNLKHFLRWGFKEEAKLIRRRPRKAA